MLFPPIKTILWPCSFSRGKAQEKAFGSGFSGMSPECGEVSFILEAGYSRVKITEA
jgi:hypothetical protein